MKFKMTENEKPHKRPASHISPSSVTVFWSILALGTLSFCPVLASTAIEGSHGAFCQRHSYVIVTNLKTEHLDNPLGIQTPRPRFRWLLRSLERGKLQSAYQLLVATSLDKLQDGIPDKWDSGKVISDNSVEVIYSGRALASGERAYWKVRVWDEKGVPSDYSTPSLFEMGLLKPVDWKGVWIAAKQGISSPLFRREFSIDAPVRRARAYISGLGYYELSINGVKSGERVLDPAPTVYNNNIPVTLGSRVLYSVYDVTDKVHVGTNAIGIVLGNGWYTVDVVDAAAGTAYGDRPQVIFQMTLELDDGRTLTVGSDDNWKSSPGPITYNNLTQGESYDARLEQPGWDSPAFDDASWQRAAHASAPSGALTSEMLPPELVVATLPVIKVIVPREPDGQFFANTYIYDFGQNFSGWTRIAVSGPRGAKLTLRYGSRLYSEDATLDTRSSEPPGADARQTDTYILKGEGTEIWEPRFTLHGFRYVEVRGFKETPSLINIEGRFVRSAVESTGSFTSSNELIDKIHHNIQWTFMSSFQGQPQDAADRDEREAWLGDPGFVAVDYIYNYDVVGFWEKWLNDIQDNQRKDGLVPMASSVRVEPGYEALYPIWPSWQSTYPLFVWYLYQYYGDRQVLEQHYASLKSLTESLSAAAKRNLISQEWIGDHMEPQADGLSRTTSQHTPTALTASAYYYCHVSLLARIAKVLGRSQDTRKYEKLAEKIKNAFNRAFYDSTTDQYATGSQTSNALPLSLGLVPRDKIPIVIRNLVDDITNKHTTHVSTGIIGSNALVEVLPQSGAAELMYSLATQNTYPSLGHQVAMGATTVCETYECGPWTSQNMKMFGSLDKFFYRNLGGIQPITPGYRRVLIKPLPVGELHSVVASERTVRGDVTVDWSRGTNSFELKVGIPAGMEADIVLPKLGLRNLEITEGTTKVWHSNMYSQGVSGLTGAKADVDGIVFHAGSGAYHFVLNGTAD